MCTILVNDRRHTVLRLAGVGCCIGVEQVTPHVPDICQETGWREVDANTSFGDRPIVDVELRVRLERSSTSDGWDCLVAERPPALLVYRGDEVHIRSPDRLALLRSYIASDDRRHGRSDPFLQMLPKSLIKASARRAVLKRIDMLAASAAMKASR
jgi:hypothetical protein